MASYPQMAAGDRLAGAVWRRLRLQVIERDGWRCTKCKAPGALEAHHVSGDPSDNRLEALVTLCRPCHIEVHRPPVAADVAAWNRLILEF